MFLYHILICIQINLFQLLIWYTIAQVFVSSSKASHIYYSTCNKFLFILFLQDIDEAMPWIEKYHDKIVAIGEVISAWFTSTHSSSNDSGAYTNSQPQFIMESLHDRHCCTSTIQFKRPVKSHSSSIMVITIQYKTCTALKSSGTRAQRHIKNNRLGNLKIGIMLKLSTDGWICC